MRGQEGKSQPNPLGRRLQGRPEPCCGQVDDYVALYRRPALVISAQQVAYRHRGDDPVKGSQTAEAMSEPFYFRQHQLALRPRPNVITR